MKLIASRNLGVSFSDCGRYLVRPAQYSHKLGFEAMCRTPPYVGGLGIFPDEAGALTACENHQRAYFPKEAP